METNALKVIDEQPVSIGSLQLSAPLGIGTWAWGDQRIWGYDSSQDDALYQGFAKIVDNGVNFFDTAEIYGNGQSEILLSQFRKKYQESHPDTSIITATKFLPTPWRVTHNSFHHALSNSLKRLDMKCVDLYQIHGSAFSIRSIETWAEALADAKERGEIKEIGVSNYSASQVLRTQKVLEQRGYKLASNQVEFSLLRNNAMTNGLLDTCKELGIKLIAYSPLAMGRLTGKYSAENPPPSKRKFGKSATLEEINEVVDVLREIGKKYEKSPAQVALNWLICKGAIPIVGVRNEKQADENLCCIGWRLNEDEVQQLDKVSKAGPAWTIWQE